MKTRIKALLLSGVLVCASGLGLVGCGKDDVPSNAFEVQIYAGGYGTKMWEYVLEEFQNDHPDIEVIPYMDNTVNTQMAQRWRSGNPPDFVFLDGGGLDKDNWLKSGLLYDFSDWLKTAKVNGTDTLITDVVDSEMFNYYTDSKGNTITYGMPLLKSSYGMWYDENWFTENELSVPENYTDLMSFKNAIAESGAKTNGGNTPAVLCYPGQYSGYLVQGFILPALAAYNDSGFFNKIVLASDPNVFVDERFVDVMQRFMDFVEGDTVMSGTLSLDHTTSQLRWLRHDAALIPNGLWLRGELERDVKGDSAQSGDVTAFSKLKMRYSPSPLVKDDQTPTMVVTTVSCAIPKNGDKTDLALEFMTYLYRSDVTERFAVYSDTPSAVNNLDLSQSQLEVSDVLAYTQSVLSNPAYLQVNKDGSWGAVDGEFNAIVNEIVDGNKQKLTALEFCQRLKNKAQEQL